MKKKMKMIQINSGGAGGRGGEGGRGGGGNYGGNSSSLEMMAQLRIFTSKSKVADHSLFSAFLYPSLLFHFFQFCSHVFLLSSFLFFIVFFGLLHSFPRCLALQL